MKKKKTEPPSGPRKVFILRVWKPPQLDNWVVELQDVRTGQVLHLRSLDDLPDSLHAWLETPPDSCDA